MKKNDYKEIVEEFIKVSKEVRNQLITLSLTIIGSIYVFVSKEIGMSKESKLYNWALVMMATTIFLNILAEYFKSQHYAKVLSDSSIDDIDYKKTIWGILAEILFWIPLITFIIGFILFVIAII